MEEQKRNRREEEKLSRIEEEKKPKIAILSETLF